MIEMQYLLNVFIYDNSQAHRHKLKKMVRDYTDNYNIELGIMLSTSRPNKLLNLSSARPGLYFLNLDDLEKTTDGIEFALNLRNNDLASSIVFLTEHDIFATGCSDLAVRSLRNHVIAMSFLAKDSLQYESEIKVSKKHKGCVQSSSLCFFMLSH